MYLIGNAEEAEGLAQESLVKMKEIYEETKALHGYLKKLEESFQDEGIEEVRDVVNGVMKEIDGYFDDIVRLSDNLKAYAEILRRD